MYIPYNVFDVHFLVPASFLQNYLVLIFKLKSLHIQVRQIIQKMILDTILNVYPHVILMNKGTSVVQKNYTKCDAS